MNKIAIIVPHGDDEALGFGGAIQKHVEKNDQVHVIFARKPIDERTEKQFNNIKDAQNILKYQHFYCTEMTELEMSHQPLLFFRKLEKLFQDINPQIVYTTFWGDIHQDHKIVFDWVCRAVRVWGPSNVKQFFVGEVPSSTDQYPTIIGTCFSPNYYIPLTKKEVDIKTKAVEIYQTEICEYPHPRSIGGISTKASLRGQECGNFYAEAFMCLRYIV